MASLSLKGQVNAKKSTIKKVADDADTDTEDERHATPEPPHKNGKANAQLPTPSVSPTGPKKSPGKTRTRAEADIRTGRIIGNAFPLEDFKTNLERGDVVSKALTDMGAVIQEIVEESFSSQRYDEAVSCMKAMRDTALKVGDCRIVFGWPGLRSACRRTMSKYGTSAAYEDLMNDPS